MEQKEWNEKIELFLQILKKAEGVVIGAGAGLSAADGFLYSGPRFVKFFPEYVERYGFHDMYNAGFYPFSSLEEKWGYWSKQIYLNRYLDQPGTVYHNLLQLICEKEYFVLTTNVDHCFQRAGFKKEQMFYTQGDYGLWQCSVPCHNSTYDNEEIVKAMVAEQKDCRVPSELVPYCPICGKPMEMNLRCDRRFVEDAGWHAASCRYQEFMTKMDGRKLLFLELGVGMNTPGIIKYPFWNMVANNPDAYYVTVDINRVLIPDYIAEQSIGFQCDIGEFLTDAVSRVTTTA